MMCTTLPNEYVKEIIGTQQSGEKTYKTFDINDPRIQNEIFDTLKQTSKLASEIIENDKTEEFKTLFKIFEPQDFENIKRSF